MPIRTLVIGYVSSDAPAGEKGRQARDNAYLRELFSQFDFGETHYASRDDWKGRADDIDPLFIIYVGHNYAAEEVHAYKPDAMLYITPDPGQIFYRKAEAEEKKAKQRQTLKEIERLIRDARRKGSKEVEAMRRFAAMSYKDLYGMIKEGLLSKDKDTHDRAWDLLFGEGERHSDIVWMRMQFLAETWEHADGKSKEELMCLSMNRFLDEGLARKLDDFTEADGQKYHQYMFCDFYGNDLKYVRRIPHGEKGQDGHAYEAMLRRYETPANFLRINIEAGELSRRKEEYFAGEAAKVAKVLAEWRGNPALTKKELGVIGPDEEPLQDWELESLETFLKEHDRAAYDSLESRRFGTR